MSPQDTSKVVEYRRVASRMLAQGAKAGEVEAALVQAGLEQSRAALLVEECVAKRLARMSAMAEAPEQRVSWVRVAVGAAILVGSFVYGYLWLRAWSEERAGFWIVVPCGPLAVAGLTILRTELMVGLGLGKYNSQQ